MVKAMIAFVSLLVLGMIGLIVHKEMERASRPAPVAVDEDEDVTTISRGEKVDLQRHIPSKGLTLVEFYGAF